MPTASSARLSTAAPSSRSAPRSSSTTTVKQLARTKASASSATNRRSAAAAAAAQSSATSAQSNNVDESTRPPLSTTEIIEKATLPLSGLSARDALTVWKALGLYLGEQLQLRRRVVSVDRFGVFGYNDTSEAVFLHSSVFLQSNRLKEAVSRSGLKGQPALAANAEPMSKVNAAEIGQEYLQNCGREIVEKVIAHVVAFISTMAKRGRALRLSLQPLGEWSCSGDQAEFRFAPEFQQLMLGSATMRKRSEAPKNLKKDSKTPEEMRARGHGAKYAGHDETRESERVLTSEALATHTTREAKPVTRASTATPSQRPSQASSDRRSGGRRVAWSESDAGTDATTTKSRQSTPHTRSTAGVGGGSSSVTGGGVIGRVRAKLLARCGERGLNALQRVLSLLDTSGDGALSSQELKFGLRDLGIELSASELHQVIAYFDRNGDGVVGHDELLSKLRGGVLSERRRRLVDKAFDCMDPEQRGVVSLDDLRANYDVSLLPRVRAGKKSKEQAMAEFLRDWETSVEHNNGIPRDAFISHYHNLSACIADDSDFELLMRQTWHVAPSASEPESDGEDQDERDQQNQRVGHPTKHHPATARNSSQDKQLKTNNTNNEENDEWEYLRSVLLPPRVGVHTLIKLDDVCKRLGVNRVWGDGNETMNTRAFANALGALDRQLHSKDAQHLAQLVAQRCGSDSGGMISLAAVFQHLQSALPVSLSSASALSAASSSPVYSVVGRIRARLLQRLQASAAEESTPSFLGLNALQRTLRFLDTNGDKRLSKNELKLGLHKLGVQINLHELDQLFTCLDADRSGCIDMDEFLVAMRGGDEALTKNPRRLALVHKAFDLLDRDHDGSVTLDELSQAYDTSKHPGVLAGRLTTEEALHQFAQQWDTQDKDGVITRREFEVYYRNVSAVVDSDDYFELMMRNAWHISGGEGQSANTSNRRVLVTDADGSQHVHEVRDDLGIRASDTDKIRDKLRTQGVVESSEIALAGYVENKSATASMRPNANNRPWRREPSERLAPNSRANPPPATIGQRHARHEAARSDFFATSHDGAAVVSRGSAQQHRVEQRQLRERAALLIQSHFRGFKSRKFAECVRRQLAAQAARRQREQDEAAPRSRVVTRSALKSYYGF